MARTQRRSAVAGTSSLALALLLASTTTAQKGTSNSQQTTNTQSATQGSNAGSSSQASDTSLPNLSSDSASAAATSSGSSAAGSSISITNAPSITTSSGIGFSLNGSLPTIAGVGPVTQVVPDTSNAPFMQKSNLPEGSVFIIVGAVLGFTGLAILAWRGVIAWSLRKYLKEQGAIEQLIEEYELTHGSPVKRQSDGSGINSDIDRSVRRAHADYSPDIKEKPHRNGHKSVYGKGGEVLSNLSLDRLPPHKTSIEPTSRLSKSSHGRTPTGANPTAARNSNLFFSPTAGAGNHSMPMPSASPFQSNRNSTYLPAGYYSSPSASSPAAGAPSTVIGSNVEMPSRLSHLNPLNSTARAGYTPQRNFGPSPPGSPSLPPARKSGEELRRYGEGAWSASPLSVAGGGASSTVGNIGARGGSLHQQSSSTLNLSVPGGAVGGARAPSANLEDLFENHGLGPRERF